MSGGRIQACTYESMNYEHEDQKTEISHFNTTKASFI